MIYLRSTVERLLAEQNRLIEELKGRCGKLEAERDHERQRAEKAVDAMLLSHGFASVTPEGSKQEKPPTETASTILRGLNMLGTSQKK